MTGYTLLVNPVCGGGSGATTAETVARTLRDAGHDVTVTPTPGVAGTHDLVDNAVAQGDVLVLVGGDGTLSSVAGRVAARGGTLGIVPSGRGNDFARMLGLPSAPEAAAQVLLSGSPKTVDLLQVTIPGGEPRVIAGSAYSGLDARAGEIVGSVRWMPVKLQYPYAALHAIATYRPARFRVAVDGDAAEYTGSSVVVANSAYYGNGMKIAPDAAVDDGLLDVVIIEAESRRTLMKSLPKVYQGAHVDMPGVHVRRGQRVEVTASPQVSMGGDGEPVGRLPGLSQPPAVVEVLPGALAVLLP
jgi:YegS/Rv2252/BmrU family lipid kinase